MRDDLRATPVVILCGGTPVAIGQPEGAGKINKGLVGIRGKPLFWWVMRHYAQYGAVDFLLATGYQGPRFAEMLEQLGAEPEAGGTSCYQIRLGNERVRTRLVATPDDATTSARLSACKTWLADAEDFCLSYSDTLSDIDLCAELQFHRQVGLTATLLAAQHPVRFRILGIRQGEYQVRALAPRPVIPNALINGGYYIFRKHFLDDPALADLAMPLERAPLEALAASGQLAAFEHHGDWQPCDADRDLPELSRIARQMEKTGGC